MGMVTTGMADKIKKLLLQATSARARWTIVLGLTICYVLAFRPLSHLFSPAGAPLVALPVIAAGWYFGFWGGLISSLLSLPLNILLSVLTREASLSLWTSPKALLGTFILILVGVISSYLRKWVDERNRVEAELRSRERYFALINIMVQDIMAPKHPDDTYFHLVNHLANLFEADYAYLIHWDAAREQSLLIATTAHSEHPLSSIKLEPGDTTVTASILRTGRTLVIDDVQNSQLVVNPSLFKERSQKTRSALGLPLMTGEFKFGAVILAFDSPHHFTAEEISRAEQAGKNITLALRAMQQQVEIQKRLREANALANIERALSETERLGIETVLQLIVDSAMELIPDAKQAVIHLLDKEKQTLTPQAVAGIDPANKHELKMRLGEGVAGQVIASGEVINIADVESDLRFLRQTAPVRFRSLMVAPVQSGAERTGTISIQSDLRNAFTSDNQRLLSALGVQAAIAIENARLLETTRQGLNEVNALYRISQGLAASLEPNHLLKDVVNLLQEIFGYYAQVYVIDTVSGDLILQQGSGQIGAMLKQRGHRLAAGAGIVGHVAETGEPFVTNNVDQVLFFIRNPLLPDTQSELAVPIKIDERILGVLDIQQGPEGRLTQRDQQLVSTVADQLAVALQKADLYASLQESLRQEKAVRSQLVQSDRLALVGRLLASVSHELNNPLQAIQNALFLLKEEKSISNQGQQDLQIVLAETERMAALIERLRSTYRPTRMDEFQLVQINNIVEDVYALMATHLRHKEIAFEFHPDPKLPAVAGLPDQLKQVVLNLFVNSVDAMSLGGHLRVKTQYLFESSEILLSVSDNGPGIDPIILPQIFDAFVTSKESGTGLGLTVTYDIVHQHNGRVQAENNPDKGATFSIWLPVQKGDKA